eukprot:TRINITY_DN17283_c0_g2_i3.p3 TRINITY_DN17283_c0_g2~~TRINITY_DN17283_c0_g2_i3.p3  ORF type:complete len:329 (-),score=92.42 TRINITY_DN17283_c0_g2_i3:1212-2198(-)
MNFRKIGLAVSAIAGSYLVFRQFTSPLSLSTRYHMIKGDQELEAAAKSSSTSLGNNSHHHPQHEVSAHLTNSHDQYIQAWNSLKVDYPDGNYPAEAAFVLMRLSDFFMQVGDHQSARDFAAETERVLRLNGGFANSAGIAIALTEQGTALLALDKPVEALRALEAARDVVDNVLNQTAGAQPFHKNVTREYVVETAAYIRTELAVAQMILKQHEQAAISLEESLRMLNVLGEVNVTVKAKKPQIKFDLASLRNDVDLMKNALEEAQDLGIVQEQLGGMCFRLATALLNHGDKDEACSYFSKAVELVAPILSKQQLDEMKREIELLLSL